MFNDLRYTINNDKLMELGWKEVGAAHWCQDSTLDWCTFCRTTTAFEREPLRPICGMRLVASGPRASSRDAKRVARLSRTVCGVATTY